ncbi:acyl-CoA dehydrogenase [Amycolatopsis rubida]|uniref:Acyl-CoA dehydrogenase n=1 Tax=Amycolatopsis rubida TaxID=112413 RepID=A0ABX0C2L5_9PSEU|nr:MULTISPECIES: acyl-CoA dehydrogenase family protein [Amycolatopsis]MYW96906.1 acyl-CoA dehydrogenase [Amycolatopsis rubida]NEC61891.1 acyl-CoA dehydrogenase [Amycolatopsis rubida]OAP23619.1 Acyl-CoA dehydrogenase [Amycolatopsis sp. M39]
MDFTFTGDEDSYRRELRRFAAKVLAPHYQSDDKAAKLRPQLVADLASMGLTGLRIPERHGGQEASAVVAGMAAEEVAHGDFNAAYLIIVSALVSDILTRNATEEQQAAWLPPIASGEVVPAFCITEPGHGTDAAKLEMKAEPDGDGWRLTGEKTSITLGMSADVALVLARTGGPGARGVSAFWVELDDAYVSRAAFDDLGSRAIGRASLHFDGLPVPKDALVGGEGQGFVSVMQGFDYSRAIIGLACLGAAQVSLDEALQWSRDREAFGSPIGTFQGVAFPLAEQATYLRGARHVCYEALWRKDNEVEHSTEAAMAKFWAPKLAAETIHQCLLTFGHLGYSSESPVGQRLRDVIGLEIGDGTAQVSKLVIARNLLGRAYAP